MREFETTYWEDTHRSMSIHAVLLSLTMGLLLEAARKARFAIAGS